MSNKKQKNKKTAKKSHAENKKSPKGIIIAAVAVLVAVAAAVAIFLVTRDDGKTPSTKPVETLAGENSEYTYAKYKNTKLPVEFVEILNQAELDSAEMCKKYGVALELGDRDISMPEFVMYYYDMYSFQTEEVEYSIQKTGANRTGYELDRLPREQSHLQNKHLWSEEFTLEAIETMTNNYSVFDLAVDAGYEMEAMLISETISSLDMVDRRAERENSTPEAELAKIYCDGVTPAMYKAREIMVMIASGYESKKYWEIRDGYSETDLQKEFENPDVSYSVARLRVYPIEGEYNEAEVLAVSNEKEFLEYAQKNYPNDNYDAEFSTECGYITKEKLSSVYGDEVGEWAFAEGRKKGDIAVVEGMLFRYLVYMDTPQFFSTSSDIIVVATGYEDDMTEKERSEIYKQMEEDYLKWKKGEATKESFLEYAKDAGSTGEETVSVGEYYFEFDNWIHNPERKSGDSAIIDSNAGVCAIYYIGKNSDDYDWKDVIRDQLAEEEIKELFADAQKDYKSKRKETVLNKAYAEADNSIKRNWKRLEEREKNKQ